MHFVDKDADLALFSPSKIVNQQIDRKRRNLNTRYHTAAHLIGYWVEELLRGACAVKSHSFPNEAYVECTNIQEVPESFIHDLNNGLAESIRKNLPLVASITMPEALAEIYPGSSVSVPESKPFRVVTIGKFRPIPCGGTHVQHLGEIGSIALRSIKNKNGRLTIRYCL